MALTDSLQVLFGNSTPARKNIAEALKITFGDRTEISSLIGETVPMPEPWRIEAYYDSIYGHPIGATQTPQELADFFENLNFSTWQAISTQKMRMG